MAQEQEKDGIII